MKPLALIGNLAAVCFITFLAVNERRVSPLGWTMYGAFVVLFLTNFMLLLNLPAGQSRLSRMIGYWMDAKENELKARAGKETN